MSQYLLVKGTAGLGNRIFVLVTAILYARMSDRALLVDWTDDFYTVRRENVFWQLFRLKAIPHEQQLAAIAPETKSVYPSLWKGKLTDSIEEVIDADDNNALISQLGQGVFKKYACSLKDLSYGEEIAIASGYDEEIDALRPLFNQGHAGGDYAHFKGLSKGAIFNETFYKHVELAPLVQARLDAFKAEHFADKTIIGIHIRMSDKAISLPWYKQALSEQLARSPQAHIFLATDNRDVEQEIREQYPNVITLDKWLPEPGVRAHRNTDCPDLEEHAVTALLDIGLLASCDYLVYSRTTSFGRLASYISKAPEHQHFDIQLYNDRRRKGIGERIGAVRDKVKRYYSYGLALLRLKGILPQK